MLNTNRSYCHEFYVVEKSIQVEVKRGGQMLRVRIEALFDPNISEKKNSYSTKAYTLMGEDLELTKGEVWTTWGDFPFTHGDSADSVLNQALGFLEDRCDK